MIRILIVDDSNDKVARIIKTIRAVSEQIEVEVAVDFVNAQRHLISNRFDLLVLDINLPVRIGEIPSIDVGKNLLSEITRKQAILSPYFIITLTQFKEECENISDVWQIIKYDPEVYEWQNPLINLIKHIVKTGITSVKDSKPLPCLYLEGKIDERILLESINLFMPEKAKTILTKTEKGAGASWVSKQIISWAYSLKRDKITAKYIKAVGLLDSDLAGKTAKGEIDRVVQHHSAESTTFKVIKLSATYAEHIRTIKQKGLDLPITLEEMFAPAYWKYAEEMEWLEMRNNVELLLQDPARYNKFDVSLKEHIDTLGLNEDEYRYIKCFKEDCKDKFADYILGLPEDERREALISFKRLLEDVFTYIES